jgi:hypothetical protein
VQESAQRVAAYAAVLDTLCVPARVPTRMALSRVRREFRAVVPAFPLPPALPPMAEADVPADAEQGAAAASGTVSHPPSHALVG